MTSNSNALHNSLDALVDQIASRLVERQQEQLARYFATLEMRLEHQQDTLQKFFQELAVIGSKNHAALLHVISMLERDSRRCEGPWQEVIGLLNGVGAATDRNLRQMQAGFDDARALQKLYADRLESAIRNSAATAVTPTSTVADDKLAAYQATNYHLGREANDIVLKIGKHSPALAEFFAATKTDCGAFITAYNPEGTQQPEEANQRDHHQLVALVTGLGLRPMEGQGVADAGDWPAERSVFVLGLDKTAASDLGRRFRQDAIVWVGADAVPELVMLR